MLSKEELEKDETKQAKKWLSALNVNNEFEASSKEIILSYVEELEFQNQALKAEHKHNINKIAQLKQENNKLNKMINEMANIIKDYDIDYSDICKYRIVRRCEKAPTGCKNCLKQYLKRK